MARRYQIYVWKKAPFIRLLLPFMAGIVFQYFCQIPVSVSIRIFLIAAVVYFALSRFSDYYSFKNPHIQGFFLSVILFAIGILVAWQKDVRNQPSWYGHKLHNEQPIIVSLAEPLVEKGRSFKALAEVEGFYNGKKATGRFLVYFSKDSLAENLQYGDRILISRPLQPIKNPGNPGEFDYKQYLAFQQIHHQVFLKSTQWKLLPGNRAKFFKTSIFKSREHVIETIDRYIEGNNQTSLAKALLIGYRVDLDKDLVQAYSNVGVVHLIAISGLHMALIYGLLYWVAIRIPGLKKAVVARTVLILLFLWFFAFLTGAAPSVLRAAVMFSFVSVGALFTKGSSIFNSITLSAFCLLLFDPYTLWNVGFQLSYLAVLGIVLLQKPIYSLLQFSNKIMDYTWQIASVSIAAQLFTVPICFYYFHQLPLLFILANIIAIPLATLGLWGLICLVCISYVPYLSDFTGSVVSGILWVMNQAVLLINKFPFALWENVSLTAGSTLLLYIMVSATVFWLLRKNKIALQTALISTLIFVTVTGWENWKAYNQRRMVIYNIPSQNVVDFFYGHRYRMVADQQAAENKLLYNFHLKPARIYLRSHRPEFKNEVFFTSDNFYKFFDIRMVIIDTMSPAYFSKKMEVDYILITNNPKVKIADLLSQYQCSTIIFSASNSPWKIAQWKKECEALLLRSHSVAEQGAFVISF